MLETCNCQKKPKFGGRSFKRKTVLISADEDETTLDLNMVQVGRLISDGAFNLEVCRCNS
jgi:hypothetical protein